MEFYGLWTPRGDTKKVEDCLETGIWHRGQCPDEDYEKEKINKIAIGSDVFLYKDVEDVPLASSPFAALLPSDEYDLKHTTSRVKCYSIGRVISVDTTSLSITVAWQKEYSGSEWFTYHRQNGVWVVHNNKNIADELEKIIFKQQDQNYEILVKGYFKKYQKQNNMEQKFNKWLLKQTTQQGNIFTNEQTTNLCKDLKKTIPSWEQVEIDESLFEITDVTIINDLYRRCLSGGDLKDLCKDVGNNRPSNALARYKEYLNEISTHEDNLMPRPLNQILYGPPGTGKTYSTVGKALEILEATDEQKQNIKSIGQLKSAFGSQVEFVTFHQSFSYEDFVEGLKAHSNDGQLTYDIENGIFKEICENAQRTAGHNNFDEAYEILTKDIINKEFFPLKTKTGVEFFVQLNRKNNLTFYTTPDKKRSGSLMKDDIYQESIGSTKEQYNWLCYVRPVVAYLKEKCDFNHNLKTTPKKPHILIIDEINRGNISRIFGELITLIEESKRAGNSEEISVQLPYSKKLFSVPNNLYIIGTMNTADRSLALMDTALRRRFDFIEMMPNTKLKDISTDCGGVDLRQILQTINKKIEILYDREHTIGHSFLMHINNLSELQNAFKNKILPLLEEYFYDDWQKICLVLNDTDGNFYAQEKGSLDDFEKTIYRKQELNSITPEVFQNIYA